MRIAREEIFGPVMAVIPFDSEEQAYTIANDCEYGLAAGVWTRDLARAHRASQRLDAGTVWVNTYLRVDPAVPYGGVKQSGFGLNRKGCRLNRRAYALEKCVDKHRMREIVALLLTVGICACSDRHQDPPERAESRPTLAVDGARIGLFQQEPSEWLSTGRTYSEQHYSPLDRITAANVSRLGVAWGGRPRQPAVRYRGHPRDGGRRAVHQLELESRVCIRGSHWKEAMVL